MQQSVKKDRFIPLRKADVIQSCISQGKLSEQALEPFESLCKLMISTLHYEYHQTLEVLKDSYAPFDPNTDTFIINPPSETQLAETQKIFSDVFASVLNAANFEKVTEQDLREALQEESLFKVRLVVDFEDFAEVVFYRRGEYQRSELISRFWGLKKEQVTFTNYDKVAVYIKFKDAEYFRNAKRNMENFEPNSTIIKLFQNVPKADLEMLFPNSEVRMRTLDKMLIGGSAVIGGTIVLVTKLGASILLVSGLLAYWIGLSDKQVSIGTQELIALGVAAGVLGAFIFKEWSKFKNRKLKFLKTLADNLYFKNLDNNAGVFHHLIDSAEEEECKEAILAYYFLLIAAEPLSAEQLDHVIEQWFFDKYSFHLNFEVEDALAKLIRFGIITYENKQYSAKSIASAHKHLDESWDALFS